MVTEPSSNTNGCALEPISSRDHIINGVSSGHRKSLGPLLFIISYTHPQPSKLVMEPGASCTASRMMSQSCIMDYTGRKRSAGRGLQLLRHGGIERDIGNCTG